MSKESEEPSLVITALRSIFACARLRLIGALASNGGALPGTPGDVERLSFPILCTWNLLRSINTMFRTYMFAILMLEEHGLSFSFGRSHLRNHRTIAAAIPSRSLLDSHCSCAKYPGALNQTINPVVCTLNNLHRSLARYVYQGAQSL